MEPKQSGENARIERTPTPAGQYGDLPVGPESLLGVNPESGQEKQPEVGEIRAEAAQVAMPTLNSASNIANEGSAMPAPITDNTPIVANDDDLIEKEWVDKAKKILAETRDDPYRREREISKLQIEYIRKRYGREIGDSGD